jgi:hypothetical protein
MDGMNNVFREPSRDPLLGNALREIEGSMDIRDPQGLRERILAAARLRLAEIGSRGPRWWELLSTWSRIAVPIGLAASLAAGLLLQHGSAETLLQPNSGEMGSDSTLVLAALSEPAAGILFTSHLIAPEGDDWLLRQAVAQ